MATTRPTTAEGNARGRRTTAIACLGLAAGMVGAAYASVPLYNLFCRVTGFDGTPLVSATAPDTVLARTVRVRFDTNVAPGLDWSFVPEQREVTVRVGETQTLFFRVRNEGRRPAAGVATYNVVPAQTGAYFVKMKCFCFDEQSLKPGELLDFPVVFYVDPKIADDPTLDDVGAITLSYTYFAARNGQPLAANAQAPKL